jgi:hypothetical protein
LEAGASLNLARGRAQHVFENLRSRAVQGAEALYAEVEAESIGESTTIAAIPLPFCSFSVSFCSKSC